MRDFDSDRDFCQSGEVRYKEKNPRHIAAGYFFEEGKAIERKSFVAAWSISFLILLIREKNSDKRERKLLLPLSFIFTGPALLLSFELFMFAFFLFNLSPFKKNRIFSHGALLSVFFMLLSNIDYQYIISYIIYHLSFIS